MDQEQAGASSEQQVANNRERMILLDIAPDGKTVNEAQSLSSHWQILRTTVSQAPSWADEVSRKDIPGLMLNIQGMESGKLKSHANRRKNSQEDTRRLCYLLVYSRRTREERYFGGRARCTCGVGQGGSHARR